jgi:glycosyltransferase involved in cell wall biosynthesis
MDSPFFSIIIPTRNRYETLRFAIRTVIEQDFSSFELIIADNSDPENFGEISAIDEYLKDARVKYFRPDSNLPMSDNWEFAVSKSSGEFVIIFGDDDGLVAGSLAAIHRIIKKTGTRLVSWNRVEYSWPDRLPKQYANITIIPFKAGTGVVDSKRYIRKIIRYEADYRNLPMFYNSAVNKELITLLKEKTGRVFSAFSPDVYTGYAFAHLMKEYITVGYPLSINGLSSKSNGAAHLNADESAKADYWKLMRKSEIKWPSLLPEVHEPYLGMIEPFIQLANFFPELNAYISRKEIYTVIVDRLAGRDEEDIRKKTEIILESAKEDHNFYRWLSDYIHKAKPKITRDNPTGYEDIIGFSHSHLIVDASKMGVKNVFDLSVFLRDLLGKVKDQDYEKPVRSSLLKRARKAAGIVLRPE